MRKTNPSEKGKTSLDRLVHPFPPLWSQNSRALILGSFPSIQSREQQFYYGHPQNRFWKVLSTLYHEKIPETIKEKKSLILSHDLALWDSIGSCIISGSADASIRDAQPNDISPLLKNAPIQRIFCNGTMSYRLYEKCILPLTKREAIYLPSTSPANARWTLDQLVKAWSVILES